MSNQDAQQNEEVHRAAEQLAALFVSMIDTKMARKKKINK